MTTIMVAAPKNSTRLRSATDTEEPTADLICVVSAVSREIISPVLAVSKNDADSVVRCANTAAAQIGDHALAERGDEVVAAARSTIASTPTTSDHHAEIAGRSGRCALRRSRSRSSGGPRPAPPASPARRPPAPPARNSDPAAIAHRIGNQDPERLRAWRRGQGCGSARPARQGGAAIAGGRLIWGVAGHIVHLPVLPCIFVAA